MRRNNFIVSALVAIATFAALSAFVHRPYYGWHRGWGWGHPGYYNDRYHESDRYDRNRYDNRNEDRKNNSDRNNNDDAGQQPATRDSVDRY